MRPQSWINLLLTAALGLSPGVTVWADDGGGDAGGGDTCSAATEKPQAGKCSSLISDCQKLGADTNGDITAGSGAAASAATTNPRNGVNFAGETFYAGAVSYADAIPKCQAKLDKCHPTCGDKSSDEQACKKQLNKIISCYQTLQAKNQSTADQYAKVSDSTGATPQSAAPAVAPASGAATATGGAAGAGAASGGGGGGFMSGLSQMMPMLMMGGMMAMMMNKKDSSSTPAAVAWNPNAALQQNGTVDCSKVDSFLFNDCTTYLSTTCAASVTSSTYLTDANCQRYSARYCGGDASGQPLEYSATMPAPLTPGAGVGSAYCQEILQVNFCQVPGRAQCPSCLQLQKIQSSICINNPAVCMGNSSAAAQAAVAGSTCPVTDPIYAAGASTTGAAVASATAATTAAPSNIVVPQSVKSGAGFASAGGVGGGSGSAMTIASVKVATDVADQSGTNVATYAGGSNAKAYAGGSNGLSANGATYRVASNGARDSAGGGGASAGGAAVTAGPTSDVESAYGQNIFNVGSQAYRQHCMAAKLNNCP